MIDQTKIHTQDSNAAISGSAVKAQSLCKEYLSSSGPRLAVDNIDITIHLGEWVALLGPNGSGKSTFLHMISGQITPTNGQLDVMGQSISNLQRELIGVVFQSTALDPRLSIIENLIDLGRLQGIPKGDIGKTVKDALEQVGLLDRADDRVSTLSGGLARRADLARAFLHRPDLLLLDEPTTGLDPVARQQYVDHLRDIHMIGQTTIIMSTHLVDEARNADRVIMLNKGRCIADDSPSELCRKLGNRILKVFQDDFDPPEGEGWRRSDDAWTLPVTGHADPVVEDLLEQGVEMALMKPTLSDVFNRLTGGELSIADDIE